MQKIGKIFLVLLCISTISSCIGGNNNTIQEAENTAIPTQNTEEVTKTIIENTEETTETITKQTEKPKVFHFGADISHFSEEDQKTIKEHFELNQKAELEISEIISTEKEGKKEHKLIKKAHPYINLNTIEFLSTIIFKDSKNIYILGISGIEIIQNTDISTFQKVDEEYFQDKNSVYNGVGKPLTHIDNQTFQNIGFGFAKDKNGIYQYGEKLNIIPNNFVVLSEKYFINDDKVFQSIKSPIFESFTELSQFDAKTFKILGKNFTKDKNGLYFQDKPFDGDPETFEILTDVFSKDKNYVYEFDEKTDFDPKTFVKLSDIVLKDKNNLIIGIFLTPTDADLETLEVIDQFHIKDKNAIYDGVTQTKHDHLDLKTFEVLNNRYSRDKNGVYDTEILISEANPKTFIALERHFGKDDKNIFYGSDIFKINGSENVDYASFEALGFSYSRDKNGVYYRESPIIGADPQSFVVLTEFHAKDKNFFYYKNKKFEKINKIPNS